MDSDSSYSKKIVKGFAWVASTKLFVQIFQWASTIFVARLLLPEHYGIIALATAFTGFMEFVVDLGFSAGLVHKSKTTREEEDGVFYLSLATGLVLYALLFFSAPYIASFYSLEALTDVIRVVAITFVLGSLKVVPEALAMQQLNFRYRALVEMTASFAAAATAIIMATLGYNIWALVASLVVNRLVSLIGYLPLFTHIPGFDFNIKDLRPIILFGLSNMGSGLVYFLYSRSEVMIAGKYVDGKQLGYYSMASTLAEIPLEKIGMIFNKVTFPAISKIKEDTVKCKEMFLKMHYYLVVIAYPLMIGLYLVAEELITLLLTDKWAPIVPVLQVFCLINLMKVSSMIMSPTLLGRGRPNIVLIYNVLCLVLMIPAMLIGLNWGIMGMIYALAIANVPVYVFMLVAVMKNLEIELYEFFSTLASPVFAMTIMVVSVNAAQYLAHEQNNITVLILSIMSGMVTYIATFYVFFPKKIKEIKSGIVLLRS